MSDKEQIHVQVLHDELRDCKAFNRALITLAGEISCVLNEMARTDEAKNICMIMGEDAGRRIGARTRKKFGTLESVEEALDIFMHRTDAWYGYGIEV
ncbi:MAG TPA: hypothetical protein EYP67_02835, partial [Methanosarcinales archaeon]|nr:hypothetical protein [Methanosarcinales archaeon]